MLFKGKETLLKKALFELSLRRKAGQILQVFYWISSTFKFLT